MTQNLTAVYPGSFDPPTFGHIDIIKRASGLFSRVTVVVAKNTAKQNLFSADERKRLLEDCVAGMKNVDVAVHDGLTVDFAEKIGARVIIRGLRNVSDFEIELSSATMNHKLNPKIETVLLMTRDELHYVASRTIKEVGLLGGDISSLVPAPVEAAMKKKMTG